MDALVPIVATIIGATLVCASVLWERRRRSMRSPPAAPVAERTADPLTPLWTDLGWIVLEGPALEHALWDLDRVVTFLSKDEIPSRVARAAPMPPSEALDIEAILADVRARAAARRGRVQGGDADGLRAYLEGLEGRDGIAGPPLLFR